MSQPNAMNQNFPNGVPAHLNGIDSSHSSRDSSPSTRMYQIPSSQLPPTKSIPSNQLPPSKQVINQLTQNYSNLQVNHLTPSSSPKVQPFSTSTPTQEIPKEPQINELSKPKGNFNQSSMLSPITTGFTHSATSHFSNVPLNKPELQSNSQDISGQNPAQLASQGLSRYQNETNVPLNLQHRNGSHLPHQNSLPTNALPPRPTLQPSLSQPKLAIPSSTQPSVSTNNLPITSQSMFMMNHQHSLQNTPAKQNNELLNKQNESPNHALNFPPVNQQLDAAGEKIPPLNHGNTLSKPKPPTPNFTQQAFMPQIGQNMSNTINTPKNAVNNFQNVPLVTQSDQFIKPTASVPAQTQFNAPLNSSAKTIQSNLQSVAQTGAKRTNFSPTMGINHNLLSSHGGGTIKSSNANAAFNQQGDISNIPMNNVDMTNHQNISNSTALTQLGALNSQSNMPQVNEGANVNKAPMTQPLNSAGQATIGRPSPTYTQPPQFSNPINRPPSLLSHSSSPNLYQKQMPPKTNSLPGSQEPPPLASQPPNHTRTNLHANRYPTQFNPNPIQSQQMPTQNAYPNFPQQVQPNYPMQQNFTPKPQQSYPTQLQQNYPTQQQSFPPQSQANYPLQSQPNYPPQSQTNFPPQPQQNYQPQSQQNFPPQLQQNFPPQSQPNFPPQSQPNYPQTQQFQPQTQQPQYNKALPQQPQNPYNYQKSVTQTGFNKLWGGDSFDLLQTPNILPPTKVETPQVALGNTLLDEANCHPDIFRCTMTKIPESNSLLQKSRLPLGVLIHPFRDLNHLPVIQCNTIVRCRACRTYINPFVFFVDNKRWKCNLCYRVNELPEEFQYDPVTKTYGDPSRRPEVKTSTIEYIAPAEYMLRPPQPAVYLFLLDISRGAIESGYLHTFCNALSSELPNLPGDARTHIGFIAYDSALHFFSLADGLSQPHEMTVLDIDDIFLPCPDNLLVNLQDRMELISDLLAQLPNRYNASYDTGSALGAALQAAHKMLSSTGGRVTVFQASLPMIGPGALVAREDPSLRASTEVQHLNPANDFYKRLALECSGQQIAVDLFLVNSQYVDLATISGISRFSGGCIYQFPLFKVSRTLQNDGFERSLRRYLTRKIGFEAVMRIRCTRGLSIHTFHGNFFVRSTDLLSLPNVNPDAGFGMQVAIEENLSDVQTVCFQAALLYTSSKGERRIRVHTMCLPIVSNLSDVINSADQQCIIGLLGKMAVDRSMQSTLSDAREAFINVAIDILSSYKLAQNAGSGTSGLLAPNCLRLLPLYISALLKNTAFRTGISTRLDDRVKAMCDMKTRPLPYLIQQIYPDLYPVHNLQDQSTVLNDEEEPVPMPPHLQLSARSIDSNGAYLLDMGEHMVLIVCPAVSNMFLNQVLGIPDYNSITDQMYDLPLLENEHNQRLHMFVNYLNDEKPLNATLQIMRDNSPLRGIFLERFIEDRIETALSYHEFLQHLKTQVK